MSLALAVLMALMTTSTQADPLVWGWKLEQPVSYRADVTFEKDNANWYFGTENIEARATQTNVLLDFTCQAASEVRKGWEIRCVIDQVQLSVRPSRPAKRIA